MKLLPHTFHFSTLVLLSACAAGPRPQSMTPPLSLPSGCPAYAGSLVIGEITGGQDTNPLGTPKISNADFKAVLNSSLSSVGLTGGSRYRLNAEITNHDQPTFSHDTTVGLTVRYVITDTTTLASVFDRSITSSFTVKHSVESMGSKRVRLANEGAVGGNVTNVITTICDDVVR